MLFAHRGEDYRNHIKCISEDQKYGGKDFQAKANKGDVKQQQWIEVNKLLSCQKYPERFSRELKASVVFQRIQEAMKRPDIDPKLHHVLDQVSSYENVPRKRAKFQVKISNQPSFSLMVYELIYDCPDVCSCAELDEELSEDPQPPFNRAGLGDFFNDCQQRKCLSFFTVVSADYQ